MCQGLPCVGAKVALLESYTTRELVVIKAGTQGIIRAEHLMEREVTVEFPEVRQTVRLPERMLRAI